MKILVATFLLIGFSGMSAVMLGCVKTTNNPIIPIADTTTTNATKKYLALGDSYTIGQSVAASERFPAQVQQQLVQQNIPLYIVEYIATTGFTTLNLQSAINSQNPQGPYDVVSLLIGVNDQYQTHDTTNYRNRFASLLSKTISLAGNRKERVFILSIPDYSVTPFVPTANKAQVSKEIDWFNTINYEVAQYFGVSYTNITPSSREAATNTSLIANDGLHPSGLEYKKWAAMLVPKMKLVLQ